MLFTDSLNQYKRIGFCNIIKERTTEKYEIITNLTTDSNRGGSTCLQVDIFYEKVLLNRLYTSGAYRGDTDYLQSGNYKGSTDCTQSVNCN